MDEETTSDTLHDTGIEPTKADPGWYRGADTDETHTVWVDPPKAWGFYPEIGKGITHGEYWLEELEERLVPLDRGRDEARADRDRAIKTIVALRDGLGTEYSDQVIEQANDVLREVEAGDTVDQIRRDTLHDVLDQLEDHIKRNAEHVNPSTAAACWEVVNAMLSEGHRRAEVRALAEGDDQEDGGAPDRPEDGPAPNWAYDDQEGEHDD